MLAAITVSITHDDARQAGRDVAAELLDGLGGQPDLVLLFASTSYDPRRLLDGLYSKLAASVQLVGCSSHGEINGVEALSGSVTAMGLCTGSLGFRTLRAEHDGHDSYAIGRAIGEQARACEAALLVALPDYRLHPSTFLRGVQDVLGPRFPIVGGVAADDTAYTRTFELHGRDVLEGGAVALALQGPIGLATVARGGWQPIGATRRCTRVDGGVLLELDGQPALNLYREYLGEEGRDLGNAGVEFPLGVVGVPGLPKRSDEDIIVVRAVQGADEARRGLRCSGGIAEGAEVRMTRANKDDLIRVASDALADAHARLPAARVALIFDCAGRKIVLGARYKEEIAQAFARLPADVARVGFYTFGELAPVAGETMHHDETFTAVLIEG